MIFYKRGFLLAEETLKLILAVIAVGLLAYLLFALYNVGKDSRHLEFAEESIDFLSQEILAQKTEVEIFNPEKWWITSWPGQYGASSWWSFSNDIKEGEPNACSNLGWESCICICEKASPESCDSLGVCLENVKGFSFNHIQIDDVPLTLNLDYNGGVITKK